MIHLANCFIKMRRSKLNYFKKISFNLGVHLIVDEQQTPIKKLQNAKIYFL